MAGGSARRQLTPADLTARDLEVLIDLVRFGPLLLDQLVERHAFASRRAAQDRLRQLINSGFLAKHTPNLYRDIYRATPRGTRMTGLDLRPPSELPGHLAHDLAVADLAAYLLEKNPGADWLTERELRRDAMAEGHAQDSRPPFHGPRHVPDGKLVLPGDERAAIEVELHAKGKLRYDQICRWFGQARAFDSFRWYVGGPAIGDQLRAAVHRHDLEGLMTVEPLPIQVRVLGCRA